MHVAGEFFGAESSIALMRRSAALWSLLKDNPRYAYYGRVVGLSDPGNDTAERLCALARLQGASVVYYLPKSHAQALFSDLEERGFSTDRHEHYRGGEAAYRASRSILGKYTLPGDLSVSVLDADSPRGFVAEVAELCQSCEVMPVPGQIMRGVARPGINLVAMDAGGRPVASASSFVMQHPSGPHPTDVFWGMLATRQDRRGEKIALVLGAMAIVHMWEHKGARGFMTGVRRDNASSQSLCNKLGVTDSDWIYAQCLDTDLLGNSSITR
jgi:hypothetical protein